MSEIVGGVTYDARIDTASLAKDAARTEEIVENSTGKAAVSGKRNFSSFANSASSAFSSVADGIKTLAIAATGLFAGGAFGLGAFVKSASELQGMRASFESMTGSAENATAVLQQLNDFSFKTAFSAADINSAARTLLGAGLAVSDLGIRMQQIGDIAGATGANMGRLTLPLSQALARGKLQTEDFYQILDSGAGKLGQALRQELAERGMGDFQKAMEEGKVTTDILFATMEKATASGGFAFEGAIKQSQTFDGQMSNLSETVNNVGLEILGVNKATGEIDKNGLFAKLSKTVQDATKWLTDNKKTIKDVATMIIDNAVPAISAIAATFVIAQAAAMYFGAASAVAAGAVSWPIVGIVAAITLVVGALTFLEVKFHIFEAAWDWVKSTWGKAIDWFKNIWDGIASTLNAAFVGVGNFFKNVSSVISAVFNSVIDFFKQWGMTILAVMFWPFSLALGLIIRNWSSISSFFQSVWTSLVVIFTPVVQFFSDVFTGAWNVVTTIFGALGGFFSGVWGGVMGVWAGTVEWFAGVFTGAWNIITGIFGALGGFFQGVWNTIVSIFTNVGTAVGDAIGGAVRGVVNSILGFAENTINGFISAINTAIDTINAIPGVSIGKLGALNIPRLAEGAIVPATPGGILANIGEGPETEVVMPLSELDRYARKNKSGGGDNINITLNLSGIMTSSRSDERAIAKRFIARVNEELRAKGKPVLGGGAI